MTACESQQQYRADSRELAGAAARPAPESLGLPGEAIVQYEAAADGSWPHERWEFARNDERISYVPNTPLLSDITGWPQPLPPRERRVRFFYWKQ